MNRPPMSKPFRVMWIAASITLSVGVAASTTAAVRAQKASDPAPGSPEI